MSQFNPASEMQSAVEFFEKVDRKNGGDGIVWVKATAPRGAQVIVEVQTSNGRRVRIPPIKAGMPICLSKYAPFDVLKDAPDLLQCSVSGLLRLLTSAEANKYFESKAALLKTSPQALMQKSEDEARRAASSKPLPESAVDHSARIQSDYVAAEDVVNPRLHHLCAQVSPMLPDGQQMPVNQFMAELVDLEDSMGMEDLEYLRAHGYYPSVRKWAEQRQGELAKKSGMYPEADALSD